MRILAVLAVLTLQLQAAGPSDIRIDAGKLYLRIAGSEKPIADNALAAWLLDDGRSVAYSTRSGGGYENEGQSLSIYDTGSATTRKLFSEAYAIDRVTGVRTKSGKPALLIEMHDGGLGASHFAVADPMRGEVFFESRVRLMQVNRDTITVGYFREQDWEVLSRGTTVAPYKTKRYDLNALLKKSVIEHRKTQERGL